MAHTAGERRVSRGQGSGWSAEVSGTGIGRLWVQLTESITWSQIRSLAAAFSVVTLLMCTLFQSVKIGLLAMVPNISPVLLGLGVMGWLDIDLSYSTLLVAPVAIGIAVDDTMHLLTRYGHEFALTRSYSVALVADFLLLPALVLTLRPFGPEQQGGSRMGRQGKCYTW